MFNAAQDTHSTPWEGPRVAGPSEGYALPRRGADDGLEIRSMLPPHQREGQPKTASTSGAHIGHDQINNATAEEVHPEEPANTTARKKPSISRATTRPGSHSHLPKDREPRDDRTFCIRPVQRQGRGEDSKRELPHREPPEQAAPVAADLGHWERPSRHMLA